MRRSTTATCSATLRHASSVVSARVTPRWPLSKVRFCAEERSGFPAKALPTASMALRTRSTYWPSPRFRSSHASSHRRVSTPCCVAAAATTSGCLARRKASMSSTRAGRTACCDMGGVSTKALDCSGTVRLSLATVCLALSSTAVAMRRRPATVVGSVWSESRFTASRTRWRGPGPRRRRISSAHDGFRAVRRSCASAVKTGARLSFGRAKRAMKASTAAASARKACTTSGSSFAVEEQSFDRRSTPSSAVSSYADRKVPTSDATRLSTVVIVGQ
mmetsp:Transcript_53566/g.164754  ORF Transcript_53566/g.164754 Transcript_53566/m.164754 type:complete len:275 (-) Transcript_53566:12-836(-)